MGSLDTIFKAYDIRGTVPDQLDTAAARAIGGAFARFAGAPRVLVARDMRESGKDLAGAFAEGVTAAGVDVVDLGMASTDLAYFAAGHLASPAAMFTASHNPAQYNGIKLCLDGARPVGQDSGLAEIKAMAETGTAETASTKGTVSSLELLDDYARHVQSFVDRSVLRPLRVIADTANGMGGLVVPRVFQGLPFELEILYPELDGSFPNHPADPINPDNLKALQARVLETEADVGLAFDGDADRVFLIDEQAVPMSGSTTTALVAKAVLATNPGATVIYNLICSKAVPEVIAESGGVPLRSRVGHSFIKATMAETGAIFGGEHSGHYYFRDNYRADSGLIAALIVLEQLSLAHEPLSELRKSLERYADSGEINVEVADPGGVIDMVAAAYPHGQHDRTDGLTIELEDWWFNLRPSNTEPVLRINVEANDVNACHDHTQELVELVSQGA
ncbi:MAG TPA: phosphomannomutase/phosphoglucomutase [Acidimicrobiales bacterium]|nr:phosphomannomutase/phosphoglucomutase [Acidimicrobiales bacterium]